MTQLKITKGSANVFEDLGFTAQESQNLLLRSQTMVALVQWFEASGMINSVNTVTTTLPLSTHTLTLPLPFSQTLS